MVPKEEAGHGVLGLHRIRRRPMTPCHLEGPDPLLTTPSKPSRTMMQPLNSSARIKTSRAACTCKWSGKRGSCLTASWFKLRLATGGAGDASWQQGPNLIGGGFGFEPLVLVEGAWEAPPKNPKPPIQTPK